MDMSLAYSLFTCPYIHPYDSIMVYGVVVIGYLNIDSNDQTARVHHQDQELQDAGLVARRVPEGDGGHPRVLRSNPSPI